MYAHVDEYIYRCILYDLYNLYIEIEWYVHVCTRFHLGFLSLSGDEQIVLRSRDISSGRVIKLQSLSGRGVSCNKQKSMVSSGFIFSHFKHKILHHTVVMMMMTMMMTTARSFDGICPARCSSSSKHERCGRSLLAIAAVQLPVVDMV